MAEKHEVTVYSTPTCSWCHKTEEFFKKHNIKFKSIDVGKDKKAAHDMIQKSGQMGVPVIDIDGQIIIGYDVSSIKKALGMK